MEKKLLPIDNLLQELEETRRQLYEANETIEAIRTGQVDALVVQNDNGHQLYTLKTADHAYRVFIEKMSEGAITLNKDGIIQYANSQFATMVRQQLSNVIGVAFRSFIIDDDKPLFDSVFETCWESDCKLVILLFNEYASLPVQLSIIPIVLEENTSLSIIVTDLTVQKETQKQLEERNRELQTANESLEISNHDLQQFASVASHDLQEPLRKIQMFTNLLKQKGQDKFSSDETRYLDKVTLSASRMKTLIIDVLNYSRLSAKDGDFVWTDLNIILEELLEDFELIIEEKKAVIHRSTLPELEVNRGQIRQVFQNLLSNALKFCKPGNPPVIQIISKRLATKNFEGEEMMDGPFALISLQDNGIGFDEKYIPNIFSLFERLNSKEEYEGTGIGLVITKKNC